VKFFAYLFTIFGPGKKLKVITPHGNIVLNLLDLLSDRLFLVVNLLFTHRVVLQILKLTFQNHSAFLIVSCALDGLYKFLYRFMKTRTYGTHILLRHKSNTTKLLFKFLQ